MITKELQEYRKSEKALREKIYEKLDKLDLKVDFYLRLDNLEEELRFIEIKNGLLMEEHWVEYDYRSFTMGELLDIWDSLEKYVKEESKMTKEEALKIAKKLLDKNIDLSCFSLAEDILMIIKTIEYDICFITKENLIKQDISFDRKELNKLIEYLKENNLWEVAK